jgi:hypothetical protein
LRPEQRTELRDALPKRLRVLVIVRDLVAEFLREQLTLPAFLAAVIEEPERFGHLIGVRQRIVGGCIVSAGQLP